MDWIALTSLAQLDDIEASGERVIVFKHSTRCSVSAMAKRGLEFEADLVPAGAKVYYLDLIKYRDLSNNIAERWQVRHESPQLLVLEGAKCIYHASHGEIDMVTACAFLD